MIDTFIKEWLATGASERANAQLFLTELCKVLDVESPHGAKGNPEIDHYIFEHDARTAHEGGTISVGRIDLYKRGCFILEAKQGAGEESTKLGTAKRGTPAWNIAMRDAYGQALGYARSFDKAPPFLIVCDVGYCFDLYAAFDGSQDYRPFPSAQQSRIFLRDLSQHVDLFRTIWTEPLTLDPAKNATKVTREVAKHLADLAQRLDEKHSPEDVATFLMRCIFTMFAEDVGLIPKGLFAKALEDTWIEDPKQFVGGCESLWQAMNDGGHLFNVGKLLKFNGGLFKDPKALPLDRKALAILLEAAKCNWSEVEPAIFGTLLERALDPRERHALGAHFTPRAYVERLVRPTIEEPLRHDWELVQLQVRKLVEKGKDNDAKKMVREFHNQLVKTRVLDPACGSGNFLYVALDLFKRLEAEVLELSYQLGDKQTLTHMSDVRVNPSQFLGIEVKRWAKEIAELVLWIGYLQWHLRAVGKGKGVTHGIPEPVLRDYKNIECRDAVLAWDEVEELKDEHGKVVTRWDGVTTKVHPVTGEQVPDESARVPVMRYVNPRQAEWPDADFVVGNPPYIGNKRMRLALGDGYVEALRAAWLDVPETSDLVMYWWDKAATLVHAGKVRRFGLITTNSITQTFNRGVVEHHVASHDGFSVLFAIPDHPWVDSADGAAVRVAMTVGGRGQGAGRMVTVVSEATGLDGNIEVKVKTRRELSHGDLAIGANVRSAVHLQGNARLSFMGVTLIGDGFILEQSEAIDFLVRHSEEKRALRPFVNGKDLLQTPRHACVVDLFGLSESEARNDYPAAFGHVLDRVKPVRAQNPRAAYREAWWVFGEPRPAMREAFAGLSRYVATCRTAKHRVFIFLPVATLPESKVAAIAIEDPLFLGVLSARIHLVWALRTGAFLEDRPNYNHTECFGTFPFPESSAKEGKQIRDLGEALDAHRKKQQAAHPELTITGMYNVLEKLRSGEALTAKEKVIHEQGLVSVLKEIHDDLDKAVLDAYGWPHDISDEEIIERLVALNAERAEEERRGKIRWLRPEFQEPRAKKSGQQTLPGAEDDAEEDEAPAPVAKKGGKAKAAVKHEAPAWPKTLAEQIAAVRDLLVAKPTFVTTTEVAKAFKGAKGDMVEDILDSLAALGHVVRERGGDETRWRGSRGAAQP